MQSSQIWAKAILPFRALAKRLDFAKEKPCSEKMVELPSHAAARSALLVCCCQDTMLAQRTLLLQLLVCEMSPGLDC